MEQILFESWQRLFETLVITTLAYGTMIVLLRGSGKRTLAKMKAFDFVVTIALGSSLATVSLNRNIPLAEGVSVFGLLILLQYVLTWLSVRIKKVKVIVTGTPSLLFYRGQMMSDVMKRERVTIDDIHETIREKGFSSPNEVDAVILETTGDISVIPSVKDSDATAMDNVRYFPESDNRS